MTDELHALKRRGPLLPVYATFDLEGLQDDIKKIDDEIARLYPQVETSFDRILSKAFVLDR